MTIKQTMEMLDSPTKYVIDYVSPYGRGHMEVLSRYYDKNINKFQKVLKDVIITKFEEVAR